MRLSQRMKTGFIAPIALTALIAASARAETPVFELSLREAEQDALRTSNQLKASEATFGAATEHADYQWSFLIPRLTFDANYSYVSNTPTINLPIPGFSAGIPVGSHDNYTVGPTLTYTLWDTGASRNAYRSYSLLADARDEDRRNTTIQVLLNVRSAYLQVQLALEQLRLVNDSLDLARAQNRDIESNYHAGAATRLDLVESQREVISYQLQYEQQQAALTSSLRDLYAATDIPSPGDTSHAGLAGMRNVNLVLRLDSLKRSLKETASWTFSPPNDDHPQIHGLELVAESYERSAESQKAALYPTIQTSFRAEIEYPNAIVLQNTEQNIFSVSLTVPLFEMDRTRHLVAESRKQADAARANEEQTKIDLERDYGKALDDLESLRVQQQLSVDDVEKSEDSAHLNYQSYKGGKINLTDVQSANVRALTAKVNAARVDAQMLNQIYQLRALSGEEAKNGK